MKTYACGHCGHRLTFRDVHDGYTGDNECSCGHKMHVLDGIIRGGGQMAIWRDGKEVWSGTGLEAVELLARLLQPSCKVDPELLESLTEKTFEDLKRSGFICGEQAAEANRIVREMSAFAGEGFDVLLGLLAIRNKAVDYVHKHPKT